VLRYDGLYGVQRLARDELGVTPGDDDDEHDDDPSFVLVRLPGQPLLPSGAATGRGRRTKRARDEAAARRVEPLVLHAEAVGVPPGTALPPAAEELCLDPRLTVHEALKRLHSARERLLLELGPQGRYALVKRAALHQLRLRSALELLHAGTQQMEKRPAHELTAGPRAVTVTPSPASASANVLSSAARAAWPKRQCVV
jgi:hypothetical protein